MKIAYTSNENGGGITAWKFDPQQGTLKRLQKLSTLPPDYDGESAAADIKITPDGRFAYVSNRDVSKRKKGESMRDTLAAVSLDPETGRMKIIIRPLQLEKYIRETVAGLMPQFKKKQQSIAIKVSKNVAYVNADPARLVQVLTNILSNASKYTPEKGKIRIGVDVDAAAGEVDTGRQIDAADNVENVECAAGGDVGVESAPGRGSTFTVTFPLARGFEPDPGPPPVG
ncbi:MAG: beta-propeller fold lactonase family protein [Chloroflexi bacterium]|nr:beta-propeller fold lactonase family protein [Chloroflexota bacterium]